MAEEIAEVVRDKVYECCAVKLKIKEDIYSMLCLLKPHSNPNYFIE